MTSSSATRMASLHVYYGVTDDGIHGVWKDLVESLSGQAPIIENEEDDSGEIAVPTFLGPQYRRH